MVKLIIFDADGVLIHAERFSNVLERDHGITKEQTAPFFKEKFQRCRIGAADLREELLPFLSEWGWTGGVDSFLNYWFEVEYNIDKDLIKYIEDLRMEGMICILGTNQERRRFEFMSRKIGFDNIFDRCYVSAHLGHTKPDHEFFNKVLKDFPNIGNGEVLLVDDREENVVAAKNFGIHAEFFTSLENLKKKIALLNKN